MIHIPYLKEKYPGILIVGSSEEENFPFGKGFFIGEIFERSKFYFYHNEKFLGWKILSMNGTDCR